HYEGIDERVTDELDPLQNSIGDYALTDGELPALLLADAIVRRLPRVLGDELSAVEDSSSLRGPAGERLLDCPHYTRPREWRGREVPNILLSGDHGAINDWRQQQMLARTRDRRPDLLRPTSSADTPGPANDVVTDR